MSQFLSQSKYAKEDDENDLDLGVSSNKKSDVSDDLKSSLSNSETLHDNKPKKNENKNKNLKSSDTKKDVEARSTPGPPNCIISSFMIGVVLLVILLLRFIG
ncbi:hypothetical protein KGF54_003906 [Candida jiufengensis]|uniref:uncharacterized protein n=1 Tax=Candida jiufengensis TaxID=497108 RepID=UPI002224D77B|nr:uncharacterized protein KGF54_003906 [Candida jiufengensis]KAI5950832.1 hypothetical protein KGF54_003906 [Candida jiufengensis]